ncbi:hypothetical protein PSECIP111854_04160 [Pseudoalteromonas sp. CIP111854]|uniref:Uncharacterized protein n=1 Tax=Pseudoalteromonas holothuriae TaxID=2963714 RepID=A0A9W4VWD6_9GAMM|nr:hypothetical protein [Pseudoalteromonas sp. CIP111854]CAH9067640.1 hypothetical protein PSECIP111854_04160 [Pseudoalteromonas sp. CIP111854]
MEVSSYYNKKAVAISALLVMLTTLLEFIFWDSNSVGLISMFFYFNLVLCFLFSLSKNEQPKLINSEKSVNYQVCIDLMVLKTVIYVFISDLLHIPERYYSFTGVALLIGILPVVSLTLKTSEFITSERNTKKSMLIALLVIITLFIAAMYAFNKSQSFWMFLAPNEVYF